jgi:hypothetical protein
MSGQATIFALRLSPGRQFQLCGLLGLVAALLLGVALAQHRGLSPLVITSLWAVSTLTFLAVAMAAKIVTGDERLVCYHHQAAVLAATAGVLLLTGQPVAPYLDIVAAGLGLFLAFGRTGCLMAGCCHGRPARFGVRYGEVHVHAGFPREFAGTRLLPVQAIEAVAAVLLAALACWLLLGGTAPGTAFAAYASGYAAARFLLEFARGDTGRHYWLGFSEAQWTSLLAGLFAPPVAAAIALTMLCAAAVRRQPNAATGLPSVRELAPKPVQAEPARRNGSQAALAGLDNLFALPPENGHAFSRVPVFVEGHGAGAENGPGFLQRAVDLGSQSAAIEPQDETTGGGLLVEDGSADLSAGQMSKTEFLDALRESLCQIAEAEVGYVCPGIDHLFATYGPMPAADIENAIRRFVSGARSAPSAADYIPLIGEQVRRAILIWKSTGEVTGIPPGFESSFPVPLPGPPSEATSEPTEGLALKTRDGGPRTPSDSPHAIHRQLGGGRPIDESVGARLRPVIGMDLSRIRIHTDAAAARLASGLDARAFTIGQHIAFAPGEYQPGTPVGDALLAHEIAHVVQQSGEAATGSPDTSDYQQLEEDADRSAVGTVVSLWGHARAGLNRIAGNALPALKSGLRLQRCKTTSTGPIGSTRLAEAVTNFRKENDHLSEDEFTKIDSALSKTTGDNLDLIISFYDYFSNHDINKDPGLVKRGLDGETFPNSDMNLNPTLLDPSTSDTRLGAVLLHEYAHTRHTAGGLGSADYQEGESYAIEYFYARLRGETDRMHVIEALVSTRGKLTLPAFHESMVLLFKQTLGTLETLQEVIDGKKARAPVSTLTPEQARVLQARLVDTAADDRPAELKTIIDWVTAHLDEFVFPLPSY